MSHGLRGVVAGLALLCGGCSGFSLNTVEDSYLAAAGAHEDLSETLTRGSLHHLCQRVSIAEWYREFGQTPEQGHAWALLCNRGVSFMPPLLPK